MPFRDFFTRPTGGRRPRSVLRFLYGEQGTPYRSMKMLSDAILALLWALVFVLTVQLWQAGGPTWTMIGYAVTGMVALFGAWVAWVTARDAGRGVAIREWPLLALLLACKIWLLVRRWNVQFGYDDPGHLEILQRIDWQHLVLPVRETLYSYHMPVGFWLAKPWMALGIPPVASAQIAAFISVLLSFLLLRLTLRTLDLLRTPAGLFFLYFTASMPMWLYLATMVNLDAHVLLVSCATLWLSVRMAFARTARHQLWIACPLALVLLAGLFTKYSVLLLLPMPVLASALFRAGTLRRRVFSKAMLVAAGVAVIAGVLALPGYYVRYKAPTGMWLYSNAEDIYMGDVIKEARAHRDANPLEALRRIAVPTPAGGKLIGPDLTIIWMSFWMAVDRDAQSAWAETLRAWYSESAWILAVAGLLLWAAAYHRGTRWRALGTLLLCMTLLQLAASAQYAYRFPMHGHFTTKGIYVPFLSVAAGYLVSFCWEALFKSRLILRGGCVLLVAWMLVNHLLPVY